METAVRLPRGADVIYDVVMEDTAHAPVALLSATSVVRRSDRTAWQNFDQELVILDVPTRILLGVNTVGGLVWDRLDGQRPLGEIARAIADEYQQSADQVLQDVLSFVQDLAKRGCVEYMG